jgi:hypothetical protein
MPPRPQTRQNWLSARRFVGVHSITGAAGEASITATYTTSSLQPPPAVLERAARCLDSPKVVQFPLEFAHFGDTSSSGVQQRPAAL